MTSPARRDQLRELLEKYDRGSGWYDMDGALDALEEFIEGLIPKSPPA